MNYGRARDGADHDSELSISKNRLAGTLRMGKNRIMLNYSAKTKRVVGMRELGKHYGWEKGYADGSKIDVPF